VAKVKKNSTSANATGANVGYEAELWRMADALRDSMDARRAVRGEDAGAYEEA
jgi:type I restriction enzyme M protein